MYSVLDVCRYVISYCNRKRYLLSNLKLQKLLYFIQAYFLTSCNRPCFREDIEAWDFGPVVPEAYYEYKKYGANSIPYIFYNPFENKKDVITEDDKQLINYVLDEMAQYSATTLVAVTHAQDPWKEVYKPYSPHIKISKESIREYFNKINNRD